MILARTVAIISSAERETGGDQELFGLGQPIEAIDLASGWARRIMTSRGSVCDAQRPSSESRTMDLTTGLWDDFRCPGSARGGN